MVYIPQNDINCNADANNDINDNTIISQENREILILPAGCLASKVITLNSKGIQEKKYYLFDVKNRMLAGDEIKKVELYPNDASVTGSNVSVDGQTFRLLISGGNDITDVGINFIITTSSAEVLEFLCVLPIRPEGVFQAGNYNVIIGATGKDGNPGKDGKNGTDGKDGADGGYTDEDKQQVQSIFDAFNVKESNQTLASIQNDYTRVSSNSTIDFTFVDQSQWQGKMVAQLGFHVSQAGTVTIMLTENPNNPDFKIVKQTVLNLVIDQEWYELNWVVGANQYISIVSSTDTGRFTYSDTGQAKGKFYYYNPSTKVWATSNSDLNMGVTVKDYIVGALSGLAGKKLSLLGDSITTFDGYNPSGYATKYALSDVTTVGQTWWEKLIQNTGAILQDNNAYSGSRVSNGGAGSLQTRLNAIDSATEICLIFMATNDLGNGVSFGAFDPTKTTFDTSQFTDALCNAVVQLQKNYPTTRFVWVTPLKRFVSATDNTQYSNAEQTVDTYTDRIIEVCNYYGIEFLDMRGVGINSMNQSQYLVDGLHPNGAGMALLAEYMTRKLG